MRTFARWMSIIGCCLLTSCLLFSNYPLSDENNCHEAVLEGKWMTKSTDSSGAVKTERVEIRDAGKIYTAIMEAVEVCNTGKVPSRKTETKNTSFILTKLEDHYFISVLTNDGTYQIFKIQFNEKELCVFGLDPDGVKLAEKELLIKTSDGKTQIKVSQSRLQEWCVRNAALFAARIYRYQKTPGK